MPRTKLTIDDTALADLRQWIALQKQVAELRSAADALPNPTETEVEAANTAHEEALSHYRRGFHKDYAAVYSTMTIAKAALDDLIAKVEAVKAANAKAESAPNEVDSAYARLPECVRNLSEDQRQALLLLKSWKREGNPWAIDFTPEGDQVPGDVPRRTYLAGIRGEITLPTNGPDDKGYCWDGEMRCYSTFMHPLLEIEVTLYWTKVKTEENRRNRYDASYVKAVITDSRYLTPDHSLHALKPWRHSRIPEAVQASYLERLDKLPSDLEGLLIHGAPGGGKTTWVCAYLRDGITLRLIDAQEKAGEYHSKQHLNVYRVHVGNWSRQMLTWITRDFDTDRDVKLPSVMPETIADSESDYRPVLWLEELDKITGKKRVTDDLLALVDAVYARSGLVIATSNYTKSKLRDLVGDAVLSRITGEDRDDPDKFLEWDLHKYDSRTR